MYLISEVHEGKPQPEEPAEYKFHQILHASPVVISYSSDSHLLFASVSFIFFSLSHDRTPILPGGPDLCLSFSSPQMSFLQCTRHSTAFMKILSLVNNVSNATCSVSESMPCLLFVHSMCLCTQSCFIASTEKEKKKKTQQEASCLEEELRKDRDSQLVLHYASRSRLWT